jgi:hypothetical protein
MQTESLRLRVKRHLLNVINVILLVTRVERVVKT